MCHVGVVRTVILIQVWGLLLLSQCGYFRYRASIHVGDLCLTCEINYFSGDVRGVISNKAHLCLRCLGHPEAQDVT
jgi:hypothetical protein